MPDEEKKPKEFVKVTKDTPAERDERVSNILFNEIEKCKVSILESKIKLRYMNMQTLTMHNDKQLAQNIMQITAQISSIEKMLGWYMEQHNNNKFDWVDALIK